MKTTEDILKTIDIMWEYHIKVRSHFPYARKEHIGTRIIESAPYYTSQGFQIKYDFGKELEENDIDQINKLSNWLNQNVLIRLYALMNYFGYVGKTISIDHTIKGSKELDLLRRLRNHFAHTEGNYNPTDEEQINLVDEIVSHFGLIKNKFDHFPISIDQVIEPIFNGCKTYVKNKI